MLLKMDIGPIINHIEKAGFNLLQWKLTEALQQVKLKALQYS